ncbi:MAG: NUDIX hydrolase [Candidatus Dormibacteria bacterium]
MIESTEPTTDGIQVRAAGGVVFRGSGSAVEVAIIHRPRYDDWSLPKGKCKNSERLEATALREVEEETGLHCRIEKCLGHVVYVDHGGRNKMLWHWLMVPYGGEFKASAEVDQLRWCPIAEATGVLSYDYDREILARAVAEVTRG